jgi:hypothetical protein
MKAKLREKLVPVVCLLAPFITWILAENAAAWFGGFKFGYELLLVNGLITFVGLYLVKSKSE